MILITLIVSAWAVLPMPPFPDCGPEQRDACPDDLNDWEHLSWVPDGSVDSVRPEELAHGSGVGLDVALRTTPGRWDVLIAVLDSGIEWDNGNLVNKMWVNTGELPVPQLADGTDAPGHDLDGNGLVNIQDYAQDPRVDPKSGTDASDWLLDVSDLIATFSDGVDDDGNGFVDDISGWDFFADDNNPYAELRTPYGGHGTGIMKGAAAEGNDGSDIGTCPNCAVMALRTGDAFITDGDRLAEAIAYAADMGVAVIGNAGAGLSHPGWIRRALEHADDLGVVMVAAAGDENSYHHNLPAAEDPILYVHAVRSKEGDPEDPGVYSFLNFANCNNYGPRVDFVAPSEDCASGSTQMTTGAVGLVISAARDQGLELTADEARALVRGTTFDINLSEDERAQAIAYPSAPGWDPIYGQGRLDLGAAVQAAVAGDIPPGVRITSPRWFAFAGGPTTIEGRVASREGGVSWVLELGETAWGGNWTEIGRGEGEVDGELAQVDLTGFISFDELYEEDVMGRFDRAHEPMRLLRLTATDSEGRESQVHRGIWVQQDPDLLPGFPIDMGSSMEGSPALVDMDGDGDFEIVQGTADGGLHVLQADGTELDGFPVYTDALPVHSPGLTDDPPHEGLMSGAAVGDLDGDGVVELVIGSVGGKVYAFSSQGELLAGYPVSIEGRALSEIGPETAWDPAILGTPTLGDADGDGDLDVIVAAGDQKLYVWDATGALHAGYPMDLCIDCSTGARIVSSPSVGDIDGDGDLDLAVGTNEIPIGDSGVVFLIDLESAAVWDGWPITRDGLINQEILPVVGAGHPSSTALGDLDGDGDLEIASPAFLSTPDLLHHDGSVALDPGYAADSFGTNASFMDGSFLSMVTNPSMGDLDGDGLPDVALGGSSVLYLLSLPLAQWAEFQHALGAWSGRTGEAFPGFPRQVDDVAFLAAPAIADVSGDGRPELIYGTGGHFMYAWDADGALAPGWPHFTGGWTISAPAVGDLDGDGYLDVVTGTREGWLFAWSTSGKANQPVQWSGMRHDPANTGNASTPLMPQFAPPPEPGGCCSKRGETGAAWLLFPLALLGARRRKR
jgi:hypothetical protein